ncbi:phosphoglucomutase/phosphomannomutase alpha/beta/alpha domain I [Methanolacinia petrolearia DSM 11571]|uniref:Phosphoglucomutase/phosphomannomutase alpha/beta/alpha domain I n=2 Tax=Methanolacinia TaxID=230355 RepID=E1RIM8_METP4|nr:phosphoglucomutase/phosphomannomutase alpha/beta/alpha domain I [Methanolacinia petrolearia DSM 11571]
MNIFHPRDLATPTSKIKFESTVVIQISKNRFTFHFISYTGTMASEKAEKKLFGTNGARGVTGKDMTPDLVMRIGLSLSKIRKGKIAVGMDTRTSGPSLKSAIKAGLLAGGCDVVDLGILPTPALQYIVKLHFDAGAMITASHNPPEYNGVKIIDSDGTEFSDEDTIKLEGILFSGDYELKEWTGVGKESCANEMLDEYTDAICSRIEKLEKPLTVAVDPGSGPACLTTEKILTGIGCRVHTINGQMDGFFPGRMPEPSPEGLKPLAELVLATNSAFGVAHDGDADRAVFIDDKGEYLEENEEFALMQKYACRNNPGGVVVTPVSTSKVAEIIAAEYNCRVEYTRVGSISVARKMIELAEKGENVVFGGEGNGGLIFPGHQHCRDGGMTAAAMASLISTEGRPLSELRKDLPKLVMLKDKIFSDNHTEILNKATKSFSGEEIDLTDGVRINRKDGRWALLRPSGTEPFMRLYVEAPEKDAAESFREEILKSIN